jgi:hypothetical protein
LRGRTAQYQAAYPDHFSLLEDHLTKYILAGATALVLLSSAAMAQTATDTTTSSQTTVVQPPAPPPPAAMVTPPPPPAPGEGSMATERTVTGVDAYGNKIYSKSTTYRDSDGVATDSRTVKTIAPPPPPPPPAVSTSSSSVTTTTAPAPN